MQARTDIASPLRRQTGRLPGPRTHRSPKVPAVCKSRFPPPPAEVAHAPAFSLRDPSPARAPVRAPARFLRASRAPAYASAAPAALPVSPSSPCPISPVGLAAGGEFPQQATNDRRRAFARRTPETTGRRRNARKARDTSPPPARRRTLSRAALSHAG